MRSLAFRSIAVAARLSLFLSIVAWLVAQHWRPSVFMPAFPGQVGVIITDRGWLLGVRGVWAGNGFSARLEQRTHVVGNSMYPNHEWAFGEPEVPYAASLPGITICMPETGTVGIRHWLIVLVMLVTNIIIYGLNRQALRHSKSHR